MRKTTHIVKLIEVVNRRNIHSTCSRETRLGWNSLLEEILHDNNVYSGFRYLRADELGNVDPGIAVDVNGRNIFPDDSRRVYYVHPYLSGGS